MKRTMLIVMGMFFLSGCSCAPYIRSDVFIDTQAVSNVYVMPVLTEVTMDTDYAPGKDDLNSTVRTVKDKVKSMVREEFEKRGYRIVGYSKDYQALDLDSKNDEAVRLAVKEFLKEADMGTDSGLNAVLLKLFLDKNGGGKEDEGKKEGASEAKTDEGKESPGSLVVKTLGVRNALPADTDTVMYLEMKSFIAKRGFWNSLTDKSSGAIRLKLIGLKERKVIFSCKVSRDRCDIADWRSFRELLAEVLNKIPVKLDLN